MFYRLLIKLLSGIDRNLVHRFAYLYVSGYSTLSRVFLKNRPVPLFPVKVMGLSFPNPIGLAAGFDHEGNLLHASEAIGFGFVEIGTVNIDSRNPPDYKTLVIFRNLEKASRRYGDTHRQQLRGISLGSFGKGLVEQTVLDYAKGMDLFWSYADYFAINLSRPGSSTRKLNPDLKGLSVFLGRIKQQHEILHSVYRNYVPMVAKVAVDYVDNDHISSILLTIRDCGFDGVIIAFEKWPEFNEIVEYLSTCKTEVQSLPFIVVGGIRSAKDARQALDAGASLVQIYTNLVLQGPLQTRKIISMLDFDCSKSVS